MKSLTKRSNGWLRSSPTSCSFPVGAKSDISTVDISWELTQAVELVQHLLHKRLIIVVRAFAPDTPTIYADRQKLRQVFLNLLTNASDAMPEGGTLTLRTEAGTLNGNPAVHLEFADTGTGIQAENLVKIMEPFFTTKEEGKGTGLGLAICRRVIQDHQGVIQIDSESGKEPLSGSSCPSEMAAMLRRLRHTEPVGDKEKSFE